MNGFSPTLDRLKLAWRRSSAPAFFAWWGRELAALLPVQLRERLLRGPEILLLTVHTQGLRVRRERTNDVLAAIPWAAGNETQRADFARASASVEPSDRRLILLLPADSVLQKRLHLPQAAASDLLRVVGYEIDRQTPFKPEQVWYDARLLPNDAAPGQISVELIVAPRVAVDPLLEKVRGIGIAPDAVDVATAANGRAGVNLLPPAQRPRRRQPRRRINLALAAACVLLLVLAMLQWLANQRTALDAMQAQTDTLRAQARQATALREELINAAGASGFLAARKRAMPSTLAVLHDLTTRLPPDTWLERYSQDAQGQIAMQGESAKAASLIDRLRESPFLSEPKLQGVIQPDPQTGKEHFDLAAQLRGTGNRDDAR
ncbi:MAG: PilN domain-containing protein [Proteobacteria bacterium]|nr:PilN domain-containing protein [Pseudomonadota bacterium]